MNATATLIGAGASQLSDRERWTGRHDRTGFALSDRARREAKHRAAVATTLHWADEAARCGDHVDALAWLDALEAMGDKLPKTYEVRRDSWSAQSVPQ